MVSDEVVDISAMKRAMEAAAASGAELWDRLSGFDNAAHYVAAITILEHKVDRVAGALIAAGLIDGVSYFDDLRALMDNITVAAEAA